MSSIKAVAALLVLGGLTASVIANPSRFNQKPIDLKAKECCTWGIKYNLSQGEVTTLSTLMYYNGSDGRVEKNESVYAHLLDNASEGANSPKDNSVESGNVAGNGALAGIWTDRSGSKLHNFNFVNGSLLDNLHGYIDIPCKHGKSDFGFGINPGNPYNTKIEPIPSVPAVPVPGAVFLGSIGACFVGWLRRRRIL